MAGQVLSLVRPRSVGIWVRVSTEFQAQGDSPFHHESRAREAAEARGWEVAEVYSLAAVSGKAILWHSETQRMLEDVRSGRISALIVSKFARLVRNTRELLEISEIFQENHAEIISLDEPINITTSSGRLFLGIMSALAEWEREEIAARVSASIPIRAKLGKPLGGAAPYGYRWVDKQMVMDPVEAPVRKLMYELFLKHKRKKLVARLLNEAGHRTRNGSKFSDTTVDRLLRCPTAKGMRRANYTKTTDRRLQWIQKPESEWVWVPVEACVSEELWEQVNQILDVQRNRLSRAGRSVVHLFGGLATCGCGQKMYVWSNSPKYRCSECLNKVRIEDLDSLFRDGLLALFSEHRADALFERAEQDLLAKKRELSELEASQPEVREEMDKCYRAYVGGQLDQEDLSRFYNPLREKMRVIDARLAELKSEVQALSYQCSSPQEIRGKVESLMTEWWSVASFAEKREFMENLLKQAIVDRESVNFTFHYLASLPEKDGFDFTPLSLVCGLEVRVLRDDADAGGISKTTSTLDANPSPVMAVA